MKQKTAPVKGDRHKKIHLPSKPRTAFLTENTNLMLKMMVSKRKKGYIIVNADGIIFQWHGSRTGEIIMQATWNL